MGWVCGLPYVMEADRPGSQIELLAAPVLAGPRYEGKPIYFSDVVVRSQSNARSFADLRASTWAYNEPHSHSGYNITRFMLASKGLFTDFFGECVEAGSHERALRMLLQGKVDATALDSTVLESEVAENEELRGQLRVLETWGPSPIPPWVVHSNVSEKFRQALRETLVNMHTDAEGRRILKAGRMARFVAVADSDYDAIRVMLAKAQSVAL